MTQIPVLLPGMVPLLPLPAQPEQAATPGAQPFLALLAELVGAPAATPAADPEKAPGQPVDTETEPGDDDTPDQESPTVPTAPVPTVPVLPALTAALAVVPPPAPTPASGPEPKAAPEARAEGPATDAPAPVAPPAPLPPVAAAPQQQPVAATTTPVPVAVAPAVAPVAHVAAPAPAAAPAPVAHQVFPEVVRVAVSGETPTRVVVRLQPEHLGEVRVVLRTGRAGLEVSLAAGAEARAAIREGAPELRRMLEAAGSPDARILVRHLTDAPAAAPVAAPTPTTPARTDAPAPLHGLSVDVGAGTAGGTAHGDRRDRPQQDAPPTATDGRHHRPAEPGTATRATGLDVMM